MRPVAHVLHVQNRCVGWIDGAGLPHRAEPDDRYPAGYGPPLVYSVSAGAPVPVA